MTFPLPSVCLVTRLEPRVGPVHSGWTGQPREAGEIVAPCRDLIQGVRLLDPAIQGIVHISGGVAIGVGFREPSSQLRRRCIASCP